MLGVEQVMNSYTRLKNDGGDQMNEKDIKTVCIEKMTHIVSFYSKEFSLENIAAQDVEKALFEVADVWVRQRGAIHFKVKQVLFNMEKFRPEIRSAFQKKVFDLWRDAYKKLDRQETKDEIKVEQDDPEQPVEEKTVVGVEKLAEKAGVEEKIKEEMDQADQKVLPDDKKKKEEKMVRDTLAEERPPVEAKELPKKADAEQPPLIPPEKEDETMPVEEKTEAGPAVKAVAAEKPAVDEKKLASETFKAKKTIPETKKDFEKTVSEKKQIEPESSRAIVSADVPRQSQEEKKPQPVSGEMHFVTARRKPDWFDLLLDASAALMRLLMKIKIRRR